MAKQKFKVNSFDIIFFMVLLLVGAVLFVSFNNKPSLGDESLIVKVRVTSSIAIDNISSKLDGAKTIFVDSNRYSLEQIDYELSADGQDLIIWLRGSGQINGDRALLLGQRIYANREVVLKGDYITTGYIVDYYVEN